MWFFAYIYYKLQTDKYHKINKLSISSIFNLFIYITFYFDLRINYKIKLLVNFDLLNYFNWILICFQCCRKKWWTQINWIETYLMWILWHKRRMKLGKCGSILQTHIVETPHKRFMLIWIPKTELNQLLIQVKPKWVINKIIMMQKFSTLLLKQIILCLQTKISKMVNILRPIIKPIISSNLPLVRHRNTWI